MTKKQYASIKCAIESSEKIKELTDFVLHGHVTQAYNTIKQIAAINDKYYQDFKDVDLYWQAAEKKPENPAQNPIPEMAYNYQENDPVYQEQLLA